MGTIWDTICLWLGKRKASSSSDDLKAMMEKMNRSAHNVATSFGVTLDYTDSSVQQVESILGKINEEFTKTRDESGLHGIALSFAAYIGEVIRQKGLGGKWSRDHPTLGENSFPFAWNGSELLLYGWCEKRIFDGPGDNVWSKYNAFVLNRVSPN
ncbi:MAG: hypothetical protein ACJ8C4_09065 [Gemmataceae bacterium]